ncbi:MULTISPECIES: peptidoglycan DD-metalloendopeptidase family protein [Thiomicrorhabdus]|uniref:Peptidoglycan DD-metalloendopeptidase family protein n=1 Tax=Thiomicrorhabdus heinhorstiae TaxID=2748010 RepID=A0ABS0BSK5_9GAMM|nr:MULTISPECIES: peptidoglycan DD-metalloendopeptidase family protein [Thiomicrorhabdus]MBF6056846.1 peptidoglycan DD-metalloendopeptidase family protein [Thiomicrorhabdus heinhorstiae]
MQVLRAELRSNMSLITKLKVLGLAVFFSVSGCSSPFKYEPTSDSEISGGSAKCTSPYVVQKGDSLSVIAKKCAVDMLDLAKLNDLPPPYTIYPQQNLLLPFSENAEEKAVEIVKPRVVAADGVEVASAKKSDLQVSELDDMSQKAPVAWRWPVTQKLQYKFVRDARGVRSLEIYAKPGTPIFAVAPGEVVYSGNGIVDYGQMLMIRHDDGYLSTYAHNSSLLVQEGERVKRGQKIALSGATGSTKTAKLYLEARLRGKKVDITKVLHYRP